MAVLTFGNLSVPIYSRIINHAMLSFDTVVQLVNSIPDGQREISKGKVLLQDPGYRSFLRSVANGDVGQIWDHLDDLERDQDFWYEFHQSLSEVVALRHAGDLRFHSVTLYLLVRMLRPKLLIETGVASGKSSSLILLAMKHNGFGKLISIDLPNPLGKKLTDGAFTSTEGREVGWMVPSSVKDRWILLLGDSRKLLPKVLEEHGCPDVFFHDSLHTREHVAFEMGAILASGTPRAILIDNIDEGGGFALEEVLRQRNGIADAYRDFAYWLLSNHETESGF